MGITVIIPAYNAQKTIKRCLESIVRQENSKILTEVLVIDDGSTDDTAQIVNAFAKQHGMVRLIQKKNGGVSSARNEGLRQAKGTYIIFCDSDDEIEPQMCNHLYQAIQKHDCDMVICGYTEKNQKSSLTRIPDTSLCQNVMNIRDTFDDLFYGFFLNVPWGRIFKRENITEMFDETMQNGEDIKFVLDYLGGHPCCLAISESLCLIHTENENSLSRNRIHVLNCVTQIQMNLEKFVMKYSIKADWKRLSDYCVSLIWSNIVDGKNLGQFSCTQGYQAINIDAEYQKYLRRLNPNKLINRMIKSLLQWNCGKMTIGFLWLLSRVKKLKGQ